MNSNYLQILERHLEEWKDLMVESFSIIPSREGLQEMFNNQNIQNLLVLVDNHIVGHLQITRKKDYFTGNTEFWIDYVCVKKNYRKLGLATALLREVEKIAKQENVEKITLTSSNERIAAHQCYIKNGYQKRNSSIFVKKIEK